MCENYQPEKVLNNFKPYKVGEESCSSSSSSSSSSSYSSSSSSKLKEHCRIYTAPLWKSLWKSCDNFPLLSEAKMQSAWPDFIMSKFDCVFESCQTVRSDYIEPAYNEGVNTPSLLRLNSENEKEIEAFIAPTGEVSEGYSISEGLDERIPRLLFDHPSWDSRLYYLTNIPWMNNNPKSKTPKLKNRKYCYVALQEIDFFPENTFETQDSLTRRINHQQNPRLNHIAFYLRAHLKVFEFVTNNFPAIFPEYNPHSEAIQLAHYNQFDENQPPLLCLGYPPDTLRQMTWIEHGQNLRSNFSSCRERFLLGNLVAIALFLPLDPLTLESHAQTIRNTNRSQVKENRDENSDEETMEYSENIASDSVTSEYIFLNIIPGFSWQKNTETPVYTPTYVDVSQNNMTDWVEEEEDSELESELPNLLKPNYLAILQGDQNEYHQSNQFNNLGKLKILKNPLHLIWKHIPANQSDNDRIKYHRHTATLCRRILQFLNSNSTILYDMVKGAATDAKYHKYATLESVFQKRLFELYKASLKLEKMY